MRYCKYCGSQIPDETQRCPMCQREIGQRAAAGPTVTGPGVSNPENQAAPNPGAPNQAGPPSPPVYAYQPPSGKRPLPKWTPWAVGGGIAVLILLAAAGLMISGRCRAAGCDNRAVSGSDYCYSHKCALSSCDSGSLTYSNYCYTHYLLYDDDAESYFGGVSTSDLPISDIQLSSNSSYTVVEGKISNNSSRTVKFVKIKGSFQDRSGNVIDTDWTYAVGSEGLAPGESCKWRMSVEKDGKISKCSVSILDYDD